MPGVPAAAAAQFSVSAIASLQKETLLDTALTALTHISFELRRTIARIARRLTRKANITLGITVSVPPFLKVVLSYKADISAAANDNPQQCKPQRAA